MKAARYKICLNEAIANRKSGVCTMYGETTATGISWEKVLEKVNSYFYPMPSQVRTRHITVFMNMGKDRSYLTERMNIRIVNDVPFIRSKGNKT